MAFIILVAALSFSGGAPEQLWPAKADTIYVAATLKDLENDSLVKGVIVKSDLKPCEALVVRDANPKKSRWRVEHALFGAIQLEGDWSPRMHKDRDACAAQHAAEGEPDLKKSGATFKIRAPERTQ